MTLQEIQTNIDNKQDLREIVNQIADYLQGSGGGLSYKVYTSIFSQSGTNHPNVVVLENTLGGSVIWTRLGVGNYVGVLANAFPFNKTWIPNSDDSRIAMYPISFNAINDMAYMIFVQDSNTINLQIFNASYQNIEFSSVFSNGGFLSLPEIRVYS